MRNSLLAVLFLCCAGNLYSQTSIVSFNSSWKYLDNGSNQGTAWRALAFNDASWPQGMAQFGYGDGDEATVVSFGGNAKKKDITTYFRKSVTIADASVFSSYILSLKRDDGAVVYINGVEVFRSNMPTGTISFTTKASSEPSDDGNTAQNVTLPAGTLVSGNNVIAVEIHQTANNGADLSFDLSLSGTADLAAPTVTNYSPADNAVNVAKGANLSITFNEPIQKGTGSILIKEFGIVTQTIDITSAVVSVSGNTATIDPADFSNDASVNIEIAAGGFKDVAGNAYAGIADATTWNFTVIAADLTAPTVTTYSPADDATGVAATANLVLTFNEPVLKGSGSILVKQAGVTTQTIDVTSSTVTVSGNTVTINAGDFSENAAVNIEIAAGAFRDANNNAYAGIADAGTWNFTVAAAPTGPQTLVAFGTQWKYLDNGSNQGTAWRASAFNDVSWSAGNAELGYGDGDEGTVVSYGPDANNKYVTTYFRKTINITNPGAFASISGSVFRDDGIAIYINGTEVYRNNLAAGAGFTTLATLANDDGETVQTFTLSPSVFVSGTNVIAVEIHQNAANSTDISFDLQLIGNDVAGGAVLTRGPYLNMGNESAVTLRWRTDVATNSRIEVGTVHGVYTLAATNATVTTEHEVRITGLSADTKYFYRFGSSTQILQNATSNYFVTAPPSTATRRIRFAVFGDCGQNANGFQSGTLSSYLNYTAANPAEALLLLGDNAYNSGTDAEYTSGFFTPYQGSILKNHVLFPAPGNHDYANSSTRQNDHNVPYYSIFSNPTAAECGGVASNTEAFYSWNWGNVHFLSLDSYGKENAGTTRLYDTTGAQVQWIKSDLAANTRPWVVAYWHHPPFTMGSHNSDTETELINMRQNFIRILERMGVDLIVCGHSHDYERSYLLNNYYSNESSFNAAAHTLSNSSAKYDGSANSCTYKTVSGGNHGTVYVVAGSSGADGGVQAGYPHNALPFSVDDGGMLYLEVEDNRLDAKFIRRTGAVSDQFTIMKNVNKTTNLAVDAGVPTQLTASWVGNYNWSTGETTRSITVTPASNTTYTVSDALNCVTDAFNVTVNTGKTDLVSIEEVQAPAIPDIKIRPTIVTRGESINLQATIDQPSTLVITDVAGRIVRTMKVSGSATIETKNLQAGMYFIKVVDNRKLQPLKFIVQ